MRVVDGVVVAVAGAKGGVGTTTTSINLCAVLATRGYDVVLVETDLAMANVGDFLDLGVPLDDGRTATFHEVLAGRARLADATYGAPGGFDVVPCGRSLEGFANADVGTVAEAVETARATHEVVVLDTGVGVDAPAVCPLALADETVVVSAPTVASVRGAVKTCEIVERVDGTVAGVVFVGTVGEQSPSVDRIAAFLSLDLLGHVPEDRAVTDAEEARRPVVTAHPDSGAAAGYTALGAAVHDRVGRLRAERAIAQDLVDRPLEVKNTDAPAAQTPPLRAGEGPLPLEDGEQTAPTEPESGGFEFGVDPVGDGDAPASEPPEEAGSAAASAADGRPAADGFVDVPVGTGASQGAPTETETATATETGARADATVPLVDEASTGRPSDEPSPADDEANGATLGTEAEPIGVTGTDVGVGSAGGCEAAECSATDASAGVEADGSDVEDQDPTAVNEAETETEKGVLGRALGFVARRDE